MSSYITYTLLYTTLRNHCEEVPDGSELTVIGSLQIRCCWDATLPVLRRAVCCGVQNC